MSLVASARMTPLVLALRYALSVAGVESMPELTIEFERQSAGRLAVKQSGDLSKIRKDPLHCRRRAPGRSVHPYYRQAHCHVPRGRQVGASEAARGIHGVNRVGRSVSLQDPIGAEYNVQVAISGDPCPYARDDGRT